MEEDKRGRGRPKKSMIDSSKIFDDDDDDLRNILKNKNKESKSPIDEDYDIDNDALNDIEEFESQDGVNDIPKEDFNPLNEPVMQRSYTGGMTGTGINPYTLQEKIIEEPKYNPNRSAKIEVDNDLINPSSSNGSNGDNGGNGKKSNDIPNDIPNNDIPSNNATTPEDFHKASKIENDNLKELSAKEKREAIEKTADAILLAYRNYIPLPFVYFSKYDDKKLRKLHNSDEIDLDAPIKNDGTTFKEYTKEFNSTVEQTFQVSDEEVAAIKDPLVDVLMEKDVALTPTQRLGLTLGQLLVSKVMVAVKFLSDKKSDIDDMKQMHKKNVELREKEIELEQERIDLDRQKQRDRQREIELEVKRRKQEQEKQKQYQEVEVEEEEEDDDDIEIEDDNDDDVIEFEDDSTNQDDDDDDNNQPTLDDAINDIP